MFLERFTFPVDGASPFVTRLFFFASEKMDRLDIGEIQLMESVSGAHMGKKKKIPLLGFGHQSARFARPGNSLRCSCRAALASGTISGDRINAVGIQT